MTYRLRTISFLAALGVLTNSYAAEAKIEIPNKLPYSKPVQLKDLLSTGENFTSSAAEFKFTTTGTIHFLKAYLYHSDTGLCTAPLTLKGAVSVTDNNSGFSFTSGQLIKFNGAAAYQLFNNDGQKALTGYVPSDITCIGLYLNGGNDTNNSTICTQFDENCSGSICNSGTGSVDLTWQPNQTPCGPNNPTTPNPSLYFPSNDFANNGRLWQCTFSGSGVLACNDITPGAPGIGFNNAYGLTINNGYAYSDNNLGSIHNIYQSTVDPSSGAISVGAEIVSNTAQPFEISLSSGHYYLATSEGVDFGDITQSTGALSFVDTYVTSSAGSVAINNNYAYITNQLGSQTVTSCPINPDGSLGSIATPCITAYTFPVRINSIAIYNKYAYVTTSISNGSYTLGGVFYCLVGDGILNPNGTLNNCIETGNPSVFSRPSSIAAYNGYVYFSNSTNGYIGSCQIDTDGSLISSSCNGQAGSNGGVAFSGPGQISIY